MSRRKSCTVMFRDPGVVAESIGEPSAGYGPGSSAYSPSLTQMGPNGMPLTVYQMESPEKATSDAPHVVTPRPPSPSVGGMPGRSEPLGYSVGLLPSRTFRNRFGGATLVVPAMGANPATGPVGRSNRQQRLQAGVAALVDTWLPSQQQVRESFTQPAGRNANPLGDGN